MTKDVAVLAGTGKSGRRVAAALQVALPERPIWVVAVEPGLVGPLQQGLPVRVDRCLDSVQPELPIDPGERGAEPLATDPDHLEMLPEHVGRRAVLASVWTVRGSWSTPSWTTSTRQQAPPGPGPAAAGLLEGRQATY